MSDFAELPARGIAAWNRAVGDQLTLVRARHEAVARAQADLCASVEALQRLDDQRERAIGEDGRGVRFRSANQVQQRSLRAELALELRVTERTAERLMRTAREVPVRLPHAYEAFSIGALSQRHLDVFSSELDGLEFEVQAALEQALLPFALVNNPSRLEAKARAMREARNPADAPQRHRRAMAERGVFTRTERDGMATITIRSDAVRILAAKDVLITRAHRVIDEHDPRTSQQLQSDLASEALLTTDSGDGTARPVVPTAFITVPALTLLNRSDGPAVLDGYGPIDVETAADYCADAPSFRRVLTDPHTGAILSLERDRYRITGALREALILRGGTCDHVGCGVRASRGEADHIREWQDDGVSAHGNLSMVCAGHHTLKSLGRWGYHQVGSGGAVEWTTPSGRTFTKEPERRLEPLVVDLPPSAPPPDAAGAGGTGGAPASPKPQESPEPQEWEGEYLDGLLREWEELEAREGPHDEPEPGFATGFLQSYPPALSRAEEIDAVERMRRQRARADGRAYRPLGHAVALDRMRTTPDFRPRPRVPRAILDPDAPPPF